MRKTQTKAEWFDKMIMCLERCIELCGDDPQSAELKHKAMTNLGCALAGKPFKYTEIERM